MTKNVGGRPAKWKLFAESFERIGDQIEELELFNVLKAGRAEARTFIKDAICKSDPENRKWIIFNPEEEIYECVGIGENPPKNWTGCIPIKSIVDEDFV